MPWRHLWAKTGRVADAKSWHPLICHMIDVAMVAEALLPHTSRAWRRLVAVGLGLSGADVTPWLCLLAGAHDLGKASPAFQVQPSARAFFPWDIRQLLHSQGLPVTAGVVPAVPHGSVTAESLAKLLEEVFAVKPRVASALSAAVGGHHGMFAVPTLYGLDADATGRGAWLDVRRTLIGHLLTILRPPLGGRPDCADTPAVMSLAGFVSVVDWIGSSTEFFPHHSTIAGDRPAGDVDLASYAESSRRAASAALENLGWTARPKVTTALPFSTLFPAAQPPYPVQGAAVDLAERLGAGPSLVVIEAPMGEGKTEAALYLADRRSTDGGEDGSYVALPTQATSNQMFRRLREFLQRRHPTVSVNLQLLHGQAEFSPEIEQLRRDVERPFLPSSICDEDHSGVATTVLPAEWFTHRKRGLLAPFGVGTVDQGLMAVLRTRHVFVRLFGLAGKCVIVDEVHAYDTYMSHLLERLLEWLAALGSSVVLLSGTLPRARRLALLEAYGRGLGQQVPTATPTPIEYPRLSWVNLTGTGEVGFSAAQRSQRTVRLRHVGRAECWEGLAEQIEAAVEQGGCIALICNTVSDAQRAFESLRKRAHLEGDADDGQPIVGLFHARFPREERMEIEQRTIARFGKDGEVVVLPDGTRLAVRRPDRAVLVATQVIEQSLDLDFDLMVSDHAPCDLLLQRLGRLQRHDRQRPVGFDTPELWVLAPQETEGRPEFGAVGKVYSPHVLLRSWLALRDRDGIQIPADVSALVEAVYGDAGPPTGLEPQLGSIWDATAEVLRRELEMDGLEAADRWLRRPSYGGPLWLVTADPKEEDSPEFHQAHQALTRLSEPSVSVVCLFKDSELRLRPGGPVVDLSRTPAGEDAKALLLRALSVTDRRLVFPLLKEPPPLAWQRSPLLRHHRCIVLDAFGRGDVRGYAVELSRELGFRVLQLEG